MQPQNQAMPVGTYAKTKNPYTNWFFRVVSYIIDYSPWIILGLVQGIWRDGGAIRTTIFVILNIVAFVAVAYNRWFLGGRTGQSWGKMAMGTRLLGLHTGQPIGAFKAFLRDVLHFFDWLFFYPISIGMLWPIWDSKRQTLFGDKIMRTVVLPADASFPDVPGGTPLPGYENAAAARGFQPGSGPMNPQ